MDGYRKKNLLHVALSIIGIGALIAYVVACRPSWSPEGSKVLFTCVDYKTPDRDDKTPRRTGIAIFNKNSKKTRLLFECRDGSFVWPQWGPYGKRAIVFQGEPDNTGVANTMAILVLPIKQDEPVRLHVLSEVEAGVGLPLPVANGCLFVGGKSIARLDIESGKIDRRELEQHTDNLEEVKIDAETGEIDRHEVGGERSALLFGRDNRVYYCCKINEEKSDENAEESQTNGRTRGIPAYEIGLVDPKSLIPKPMLVLPIEGVGKILPFSFAVKKDGSAIAFLSQLDGKCNLLVIADKKLRKPIPLPLTPAEIKDGGVGNLEWSRDANTLYAGYSAAVGDNDGDKTIVQFGIYEISADTGAIHKISLWHDDEHHVEHVRESGLAFQLSLSPDGRTIAAAPVFSSGFPALYLVNVASPDRRVTKIQAPSFQHLRVPAESSPVTTKQDAAL